MATEVNYWSSYDLNYKVNESLWGGEQESGSEDGGGGVTWETQAVMEVKGHLISARDLTCPDRKLRQQMTELQERRRSLQALLSARLAELRRICLQEAELTGAVPGDFPLETGEKPPCVRRRGGTSRHRNRKSGVEEEECQRSKTKKTLFSGALRKHSDPEHNAQTHSHHGKRTVHRGCHTDDTVRSESSSTSDSTGHENDDVSQCRPLLVSAGSPVGIFYQNKTRRNSVLTRSEHPEPLQTQRPLPIPPSHAPPLPLHPPPTCSQDSASSHGDPPVVEGGKAARHSNSSDRLLDRVNPPEDEGGLQQGALWVNGNGLPGSRGTKGHTRMSNGHLEGGGRGRGGVFSEVLLDYVWGKQQQLQKKQTNSRQPIASQHQLLSNGYYSQKAPPTCRGNPGDQRQIKPDPHPHLLPPRPPQAPPSQDAQLEEATRSLHKALALEGLRDWYLRNTIGSSHQKQAGGKANGGVKGQSSGRRRTHGVIQQSTYQKESSRKLPHSATFHGQLLHGSSMDSSLYNDCLPPHKQEVPLRDPPVDQLSPGTLV
ncbi:coiled-coil domain-containing protein 120 isoform X2 [Antennarius striatus]|uniref:coiled-coil domain-containing protein 120 isoform X2 n=1 Tax=Antennarius striatus TaxID=241820 RepID=UPI0035B03C59